MVNIKTKNIKKVTSSGSPSINAFPCPKNQQDLNNSSDFKVDMAKRKIRRKKKSNYLVSLRNGMGLGFLILGVYFILILIGIISFTPRFTILEHKLFLLILAISMFIFGGLMNDQVKGIFKI